MAFGTPVAGTVAYSANGGASVAPSYPAGITSTDQLVLIVGQKPSTANSGTVTTPSGWTLREELTAAGGYGTTLGADTGNTNLRFYTKDTVTGSESGTLSVTLATNNVSWAFILRVPTAGGTITYGSSDGSDTAAGNVSVTLAANPGLTAGDIAIWAMCIPTDVTTPSQFSAHAISAAGATFATPTEINEPDSGTGNDIGGFSAWTTVSTGTASAAPTITATAGGTTTNVRGPLVLLRMTETLPARTGTLAATEGATDTFSGTGSVLVEGALAVSETGSDTFAATGTVSDPATTGTMAATETGADTFSGAGDVIVQGSLAASETGSDTFAGTGDVIVQGSLAASETGSDTFFANGGAVSTGTMAATETGADTFAATGDVIVKGSLAASEGAGDTFAGTGEVRVQGALAVSETGSDTFAATGDVIVQGSLAISETGDDTFSAFGGSPATGTLAATETGADTFAGTGTTASTVTGTMAATEAADSFGDYVIPDYVAPGYVQGVSGTVSSGFTITGEQALLLRRLHQLHGLADPLVVGSTSRTAGALAQTVQQAANGSVTVSTTDGGGDTLSGLVGTMIEELAALHGLTTDLVTTSTGRTAGSIVQTFSTAGGATTVTRQ